METINFSWRRPCPHCGEAPSSRFLESNPGKIHPSQFRSRGLPSGIHPAFNLCHHCQVLFASPTVEPQKANSAYANGTEEEPDVATLAAAAYVEVTKKWVLPHLERRGCALEVGCGAGLYLEGLLGLGFETVVGYEPGESVDTQASLAIRKHIRREIFPVPNETGEQYDLVTMFQTLEHIPHPQETLDALKKVLRPGGILFIVGHSYEAFSARLLGSKSPIYDFQHFQLYSPRSLARVLRKNGFNILHNKHIANRYPLGYWTRQLPLPWLMKTRGQRLMELLGIDQWKPPIRAGNFALVARKKDITSPGS